jgi:hypothetical protein
MSKNAIIISAVQFYITGENAHVMTKNATHGGLGRILRTIVVECQRRGICFCDNSIQTTQLYSCARRVLS